MFSLVNISFLLPNTSISFCVSISATQVSVSLFGSSWDGSDLPDKLCHSRQTPALEVGLGLGSASKVAHNKAWQGSPGCWQEASVPHPQDFSRRLLENSQDSWLNPELGIQASGFEAEKGAPVRVILPVCFSFILANGKRRGF